MSQLTGKLLIGLTGGIGSGKSTAARLFQERGIGCVDADDVARQVVAPGMPALAAIAGHFGPQVIDHCGQLDRSALRQRIFADPAAKQWLEQLLHPAIRQQLFQQLPLLAGPYNILVAPLLLENKLHQYTDRVLLIDVAESTQLQRTQARDQASEAQVKAIIASQFSRQQKRDLADDIVDNNGTLPQLIAQIQQLHEKYLELSTKIRHKVE